MRESTDLRSQSDWMILMLQGFQQIPQVSTLALMPDGKTYVVVNSPAPAAHTQQHPAGGHWLLSQRTPGISYQFGLQYRRRCAFILKS